MKKSTWKITTYSDGNPVDTAHGVDHDDAVVAIRQAMYGHDPLTANQVSERRLAWVADIERYASAPGRQVAA